MELAHVAVAGGQTLHHPLTNQISRYFMRRPSPSPAARPRPGRRRADPAATTRPAARARRRRAGRRGRTGPTGAEAQLDAVALDGVAHLLGGNKTHPGELGWILVVPSHHVHHDGGRRRPGATSDGLARVARPFQTVWARQHGGFSSGGKLDAALATTGGSGWRGRRGCACGRGSRGYAAAAVARLESALAHLGLLPLIRRVRRLPG